MEIIDNIYPTWLEINLSAIEENTRALLAQCGVPLMAVVKANAYGFGAVEVAKAILAAGGTYLAVARYCEAAALRKAGIHAPILVFGMVASYEVDAAIDQNVTLTLHSFESGEMYALRAAQSGKKLRVHLKVDTGMGRLGVFANEIGELARQAMAAQSLEIEGVFTHLSMVDIEPDDPFTPIQLQRFQLALDSLQEMGIRPSWVHATNSAAAISHPQARFNMIRLGSVLVGIRPFYYLPWPEELRRVLTWKAQLASCRLIPDDWGISYGQTYRTHGEEFIGVIPVGYADGFHRASNNQVLIDGKRVPVVGKVCSDMSMLKLPSMYPIGTEVVVLGKQGGQSIQIEDLSNRWNVSQADVTASINLRIPRIYLRD